MKLNKRLLLAGVVAALVLLAVPALALAAVWKDHATGTKVQKEIKLEMKGGELFQVIGVGGMSCEIKAILTTEGGSSAKISKYETLKCPKGFEKMEKCELEKDEPKGLPWAVDVKTEDLVITNFHTVRTFKNCETKSVDKTIGELTLALDNKLEIGEVEWNFEDQVTLKYKTTGSLEIEGANFGTYEIG